MPAPATKSAPVAPALGDFIRRDGPRTIVHVLRSVAHDTPELIEQEWPCNTVSQRTDLRGAEWDGSEVPAQRGSAVDCTGVTGRMTRRYYYRGTAHAVKVSVIGDVQATKNVVTPLPPPKTSLPTRWRSGQWEKQHKTRGWIPA